MKNEKANAKKQILLYGSAFLAVFLWASAFPGTRYALNYYSPVSLMVMRFVIASVTLIIIGLVKKIRLPKLKDIPMFFASGFSGIFLYSYLFTTASITVSAGVSSFIIAASPIFTMIFCRIFLKEIVRPIGWIGAIISFCGLAAITLTQVAEFSFDIGLILIICAAVCSGVYSFIIRIITKQYTALEATTYTMVAGSIGTLLFLPTAIQEIPDSTLFVNLVVVFMGVFPAAIAYLTWSYALAKSKMTAHVTVFSYLIPFMSALIAFVWLHEMLSIFTLVGGVVIIFGMLLTNLYNTKHK